MKLLKFSPLFAALVLAGCANRSHHVEVDPTFQQGLLDAIQTNDKDTSLDAQRKLTEAATSVSQSLAKLAEIQHAVHPKATLPAGPNPGQIGLGELASVDWTGPIEPLLQKIAATSHYKFRVLGRPPAIPILVSVTAKHLPIADIIRDIKYQAENHADVVLYGEQHILELRYPGA